MKLSLYKRIAELNEEKELLEIQEELKDRFGNLPVSAKLLLDISKIRINAQRAGIEYITKKDDNIFIRFPKEQNLQKKIGLLSSKSANGSFFTLQGELGFPVQEDDANYEKIIKKHWHYCKNLYDRLQYLQNMKILKILFFIIFSRSGLFSMGIQKLLIILRLTVDKEIITSSELKEKLAPVIEYYNKIYSGEELNNRLKKAKEDILNQCNRGKNSTNKCGKVKD